MSADLPRRTGWVCLALCYGTALTGVAAAQQPPVPDNPPSVLLTPRQPAAQQLPRSLTGRLAPRPANALSRIDTFNPRSTNQIGIHRTIPPEAVSAGGWETLSSGERIWRVTLHSPGAKSLRVHFDSFRTNGRVFVFAADDSTGDTVVGPYTGAGPTDTGEFWSGVVFSDRIVVEYLPASNAENIVPFRLDLLSHATLNFLDAGAPLRALVPDPDSPLGPGTPVPGGKIPDLRAAADSVNEAAAACHLDVSCYPEWASSARAVARIRFEDNGTFVCTGALLNTRSNSNIPYFLTNNHCVSTQAVANTLATFWNYRTSFCNATAPALPLQQSLGAQLLATRSSSQLDFAFLRLPNVPANAFFLGWTTNKLATNANITAIGHPDGDYQRITFARITGGAASDKFDFTPTGGLTEGGSSGSPWLSAPGTVAGLHARGNASRFVNVCQALQNGQISGGGEWFAAIYPYIQSYLEDTGPCSYSISPQSQNLSAAGGPVTVAVSSRTGCNWVSASNASWITVTSGSSGTANGSVTLSVAANATTASRTGTVTIAGQTFTVVQASSLPACQATAIQVGQTVSGSLSSGCSSALRPGRNAARYSFNATAGQQVVIEASSAAFDTYLFLLNSTGNIMAEDDDGGVGTNSRIPRDAGLFRIPSNGIYTIEVTSYSAGSTGSFRLSLEASAGCATQSISIGQTVNGQLTTTDCLSDSGSYYTDYYTFQGASGQQINISMSSSVIDTYLILNGPTGAIIAQNDDISPTNLNSRIPVSGNLTLTAAGTYTIQASTFNPFETGPYTLSLQGTTVTPPPSGNGPFRFVPVTPCRVSDTRAGEGKSGAFGPPVMASGTTRDIPIPQSGCDIPSTARAYSLNITVVPRGALSYLTIWPAGQSRPNASTLNSFQGSVVANASIVPAGTNGAVSVFVTDTTDVIIDINGYFVP